MKKEVKLTKKQEIIMRLNETSILRSKEDVTTIDISEPDLSPVLINEDFIENKK